MTTVRGVLLALLVVLAVGGPAGAGHSVSVPVLTIDAASLQEFTQQGRPVHAVDLRPADVFQAGRLPGAQSIPWTTLVARHRELPAQGLVVLYGADSVDEVAAAFRYLRSAGLTNIVVLEGGFAAWRASGYRVER